MVSLLFNSVARNRHEQAEKKIGIIPRNKNLLYAHHPRVKAVKQTQRQVFAKKKSARLEKSRDKKIKEGKKLTQDSTGVYHFKIQ